MEHLNRTSADTIDELTARICRFETGKPAADCEERIRRECKENEVVLPATLLKGALSDGAAHQERRPAPHGTQPSSPSGSPDGSLSNPAASAAPFATRHDSAQHAPPPRYVDHIFCADDAKLMHPDFDMSACESEVESRTAPKGAKQRSSKSDDWGSGHTAMQPLPLDPAMAELHEYWEHEKARLNPPRSEYWSEQHSHEIEERVESARESMQERDAFP